MDQAVFDELQQTLQDHGPEAAIDQLCKALESRNDYSNLFYAILLKKRHELGVSPIPTGPSEDLPEFAHPPYEDAIRDASRKVGNLFLAQGDIPRAWIYFRMIGEPEPVKVAFERAKPSEAEDIQQWVEIAYHHGVHPRRGFDFVLERFGICSAITLLGGGHDFPHGPEVREYCIQNLTRSLFRELTERLKADILRREGGEPKENSVRALISTRPWLFEEDFYHIDTSHLSAVVQMGIHLKDREDLDLARQLCEYGSKLSPRFQYAGEPPFENHYQDYGYYLSALTGENVEESVNHFRSKLVPQDAENQDTMPAEVLVNFLLRLNRPQEALDIAREHLSSVDNRRLICPNLPELCQRTKNFEILADVARKQGDPVHFMAGLLAALDSKEETKAQSLLASATSSSEILTAE